MWSGGHVHGQQALFTVNRNLWTRWSTEGGKFRFHCRYYKERPGRVEETGTLIVETMKEFVEGLRLKGNPKSLVGFPAKEWEQRYWLAGVPDERMGTAVLAGICSRGY